jgi:hypothetical protein
MVNIQLSTATSGTVTPIDTQQDLILIHDAAVTATLTIPFPDSPRDGQSFTICSVGGITTLTLSTLVGTIANTLTTLPVGGTGTWRFYNNKWYKTA